MPMAEYLEWQEFYAIEPFGLAAADAMQANIARLLAEVNRNATKRKEPFVVTDFLMFHEPEPEAPKIEPTVEGKTAAQWRMIFAADAHNAARQRARRQP